MTTPQQIDYMEQERENHLFAHLFNGGGNDPSHTFKAGWNAAIQAERKRCLAWIDRFTDQIQDCAEEVRDNGKRQDLLNVLESLVADIRDFRTRIESGEQP